MVVVVVVVVVVLSPQPASTVGATSAGRPSADLRCIFGIPVGGGAVSHRRAHGRQLARRSRSAARYHEHGSSQELPTGRVALLGLRVLSIAQRRTNFSPSTAVVDDVELNVSRSELWRSLSW